jgi:hypothetical protein
MDRKSINLHRPATFALIIGTLLLFGCIFGTDEKSDKKKSPIVPACKPLTVKENVIYNLVLAYNTANLDCYLELLREEFTFHVQERDVVQQGLPEYWTREEDSVIMRNMFLAAKGQHPDSNKNLGKLKLELADGAWVAITEFGGQPCDDCWETTRSYYLTLYFTRQDWALISQDLAKFTIVPVMVDGKKLYKLARLEDLEKP